MKELDRFVKGVFSNVSIDAAKAGLFMYCMGLFVSIIYYSRFSILALDFTKPQSILVGFYILIYFGLIPALLLYILKKIHSRIYLSILFSILILGKNLLLLYFFYGVSGMWVIFSFAISVVELLYFFNLSFLFKSNWHKKKEVLHLPPSSNKTLLFIPVFCILFALFVFPHIPSYLGGAKPSLVHIFTHKENLPANRFMKSKNRPQRNKSMDSYRLMLLYESNTDFYFFNKESINDGSLDISYTVMRIKKDEVLRIDYKTPKWF
ncbi:MAG: hypothetical protein QG657_5304 [Acidobacteriota bacterium]|nr:hypothetical protein [Acidobacteriota bacterium]